MNCYCSFTKATDIVHKDLSGIEKEKNCFYIVSVSIHSNFKDCSNLTADAKHI